MAEQRERLGLLEPEAVTEVVRSEETLTWPADSDLQWLNLHV